MARKFVPDEKDVRILVPFTAQPGRKPICSRTRGDIRSLANFEHHAEEYRLDAQFHVEREQLLGRGARPRSQCARAVARRRAARARPIAGCEAQHHFTTLDGIARPAKCKAPKRTTDKVFTHTFAVPERLVNLAVTLTGKVNVLSKGGEKSDLSASQSWALTAWIKLRPPTTGT
jgi:hypothetical protein